MAKNSITGDHFRRIYDTFNAVLSKYDCGRKCAPLNKGEPICCSTEHAIPVVDRKEFALLKQRTDLWFRFTPNDAQARNVVKDLPRDWCAIECKGPRFCERHNRTVACRAFPFFPYITREGEFIGLGYYWDFEDRCWVISNLQIVERAFVTEFESAFERLFEWDPSELETMKSHSASMRRVFSRKKRIIPLIGRKGGYLKVMPYTGEVRPARPEEFPRHGPYRSEAAYIKEVKKEGGTLEARPKNGYLAP